MNKEGLELLKEFEGVRLKAYIPVPGDVPTIGYGHTGPDVKMGDTITKAKAESLLKKDVQRFEDAVAKACTVTPNENQLAAMTCLAFNIGIAGFQRSTVLKAHNRGDEQSAARAFGLWNKSGGKVYAGLTKRRAEESALYLTPDPAAGAAPLPMPQDVDPESTPVQSPINQAGVVAGATAAIAAAKEIVNATAELKASTATLGDWLLPLALVAVVVLCGCVVWQRAQQRKKGWA